MGTVWEFVNHCLNRIPDALFHVDDIEITAHAHHFVPILFLLRKCLRVIYDEWTNGFRGVNDSRPRSTRAWDVVVKIHRLMELPVPVSNGHWARGQKELM